MAPRPQGDVFIPAPAAGAKPAGGQIFGMSRGVAIVVILGAAVAAYLLYRHFSSQSSSSATSDQSNIDPQTGFPYGSAEDLAALGQPAGGGGTSTPTDSGTSTSSDAGQVADDIAAIVEALTAGRPGTSGTTAGSSTGQGSDSQPTGGATTPQVTPNTTPVSGLKPGAVAQNPPPSGAAGTSSASGVTSQLVPAPPIKSATTAQKKQKALTQLGPGQVFTG